LEAGAANDTEVLVEAADTVVGAGHALSGVGISIESTWA
jgi:hypothetical protein